MRFWPARTPRLPKRQCPFVCEHVGTDRENIGTEAQPRMVALCRRCGTTWPTWSSYVNGAPGILPTEARMTDRYVGRPAP